MKPLFKTTTVIWSEYDPTDKYELKELANEAEQGDAYCSKMYVALIDKPTEDPDWDNTEFFDDMED